MVALPGHQLGKTVDNCPQSVDNPRGLWKTRSIVRNMDPQIWGLLSRSSKMWFQ
jgi:hypothetical protein